MKRTFIIQPEPHPARQNALQAVKDVPDGWQVIVKPPSRSRGQNDLSHAIYEEIARQLPDDDAAGWKAYCKLHHGVVILRAEDEEFRQVYDSTIKGMTYEQKLAIMRFFPVTSIMDKSQKSRYLDAVKEDFLRRGVQIGA